MKYIKKSKQEPKGLVNWRTQEEKADRINYDRRDGKSLWAYFPSKPDVTKENAYSKQELWNEHLIVEQGKICAYCGRRIEAHSEGEPRIEHLNPKSEDKYRKLTLNYHNLVAVCQGDENPISPHCDAKKGAIEISVFPTDVSCEEKFIYKWDGRVKAKDDDRYIKADIETLGLNVAKLKIARKNVVMKVETFLKELNEQCDKNSKLKEINKRIKFLQDRHKAEFIEFCFVEVYYLRKELGKT